MSFASTLTDMAFKHSQPHIGHAIGTTLGGRYHLAHGLTKASVLPVVPQYVAHILPEQIRIVSKAMGLKLKRKVLKKSYY